jgi:hypothetical protein
MRVKKGTTRRHSCPITVRRRPKQVINTFLSPIVPFFVSEEAKKSGEDLESLQKTMDEDSFYMYRYKTAYCPQKNLKHDWA